MPSVHGGRSASVQLVRRVTCRGFLPSCVQVIAVLACVGAGRPARRSAAAQRSDRATISGVVTDAQGAGGARRAPSPSATRTPASRPSCVTNESGAYTPPPLVLGPLHRDRRLAGLQEVGHDGHPAPGRRHDSPRRGAAGRRAHRNRRSECRPTAASATRVPTSATPSTRSTTATCRSSRPADVRLAEAVLQIQPGYLPMRPNGDPMFRGSQFNSRINGGQARATENVFDGAAFGYAVGHQGATRARRRSRRSRK